MEKEFKQGELSGVNRCLHQIKTVLLKSLQEDSQVNANVLMLSMLEDLIDLSQELEEELKKEDTI